MRAVEQARSMAEAAEHLRTDIELPGALRYLSRLCQAIHGVLRIIRGLDPWSCLLPEPSLTGFSQVLGTETVLSALRESCARFLPQLPIPLGFNPSRITPRSPSMGFQHRMGRDPPNAFIESAC